MQIYRIIRLTCCLQQRGESDNTGAPSDMTAANINVCHYNSINYTVGRKLHVMRCNNKVAQARAEC